MRIEEIDEFSPWEDCVRAQRQAALGAARRAAAVAAYRSEWTAAGLADGPTDLASFARIPTLSKERLVEAAAAAAPFGNRLGVERAEIAHVFAAPGPLYMPFTREDLDHVAASFAKALRGCGFEAGDLVNQTTMYNWVIAATAMDRALGLVGCGVVPGGIGQSERHLEVMERLRVDAILAFPTFLEHLLEQAAAQGLRLPLRKAAVMGELRDPDAKRRMQHTYGVVVREFYGVADVGAVAWECSAGAGMHLRDDLLVEFMAPGSDESMQPAPGQPAELVVTDFHRRAMPIIRLRTGDLVDGLVSEPCTCGRTSPRFSRIIGRASEITKVKGMFVVPRVVSDVMVQLGIDRPFRLLVDRDTGGRDALSLEVAGEPLPNGGEFHSKVENGLRMRLDLRFVATLPDGGPRLVDRRFAAQE